MAQKLSKGQGHGRSCPWLNTIASLGHNVPITSTIEHGQGTTGLMGTHTDTHNIRHENSAMGMGRDQLALFPFQPQTTIVTQVRVTLISHEFH